MTDRAPIPSDLVGLLTEAEQQRFGVLARNALIRQRYAELRRTNRTVSVCLVALRQDPEGPGHGLSTESLRRIVYAQGEDTERPWLTDGAQAGT